MSSVEGLREFVSERLTAAAEEIFGVFKQTIVEYEEEIDRQRRLLDIALKPDVKLHRIEPLHQRVCTEKEEVPAEQQLCESKTNSSLHQEDPEPPQIKEEQEELCTSQEGGQPALKQETDTFMWTPTDEEHDLSGDETMYLNRDLSRKTAEEEPIVIKSVLPELNSDPQLLSHNSSEAESQIGEHGDSASAVKKEETREKRILGKCKKKACKIHLKVQKKLFKCDTCGKEFKDKSKLNRHLRVHTGEKPFLCNTCGNSFSDITILRRHKMIHTGERPYSCKTCGKNFRLKSDMQIHQRTHTGEKPYNCETCWKRYSRMYDLRKHIILHTSEKQCST